jgi:hypothetical protein
LPPLAVQTASHNPSVYLLPNVARTSVPTAFSLNNPIKDHLISFCPFLREQFKVMAFGYPYSVAKFKSSHDRLHSLLDEFIGHIGSIFFCANLSNI